MNATDTSTAAYDSIRDQLSEKQRAVRLMLLKFGPMTNEQIAEALGWPINTVTPRLKELRDLRDKNGRPCPAVVEAGYTVSARTGRKAHLWKLKYEPPAPKPATPTNSLFG